MASHGSVKPIKIENKIDGVLLISIILLTLFGLFMIYDASSVIAFRDFGDKFHYIKDQLIWTVLGLGAMTFFIFFDYRKLYNLSLLFLLGALGLLVAVFIPGIGSGPILGAHRWINLRVTVLQPTEFVKLSLAIYLAAWFSQKEKGRFLAFCLLIGAVIFLVMAQPDMGTASIIFFEAFAVYFLSGGEVGYLLMASPLVALGGFILIKIESYRASRLTTFLDIDKALNSSSTASPAMWHIKQVLIALGSGGIFGVGLGNSLQKYAYLPENATDSIFAIIAEELGFFGSLFLMLVFLLIIWRGFYIASHVKDAFGKLLAIGIIAFLGIQVVINLGAMTALLPLTGVPLPFISYGGSALIVDLSSIGILLNISRHMT